MKKVKIGLYDCGKLQEAKKIICDIYEYYYDENSDVSRRLETILKKIDYLLDSCCSK